MTGRTHDLAAVTALTLVAVTEPLPHLNLATLLAVLVANMVGGVAPDIDQPTAPLWRNLPIGGVIGRIVDRVLLGGHRFLTHSLIGLVLFGALVKLALNVLHPIMASININLVWWAFMIGAASHLAMDLFTKEGVPLLLPLPYKFGLPPVKTLRVTTGRFVESGLIFPGLIVLELWLCYRNYTLLLALAHGLR